MVALPVVLDAQQAAIFDAAPDGIVLADGEWHVVGVNPAAERAFGRDRRSLLGQPLKLLFDLPANAADGEPVEIPAYRADGTTFPVELRLRKLPATGGALHALFLRDISERQQNKEMRERLMIADRMASIGQLAAGVAHEINNPLAYVMANLAFVSEQVGAPDGSEIGSALREAQEGARRVQKIVRDLKTLSRPERESRAQVDVNAVLESSIQMAWNEIRHRARLERELAKVPAVFANESQLGQVFLNLLINSAQAMPDGRADENVIRAVTRTDAKGQVVIEICDTGTGIPPQLMRRIFDPFFTTKPVGVGTGLGLSICHRIVSSMAGTIMCESEPGRGTTMRVTLPASGQLARLDATPPAGVRAVRRGRILVIDDEEMIGKAVKRALPEHDVETTTSAREALDRLKAGERWDLVLCDVMMPVLSGMEFHQRLAAQLPSLSERVVFLTGGAFTPAAQAYLDDVSNLRIDKPFNLDLLRQVVADFIG